MSSPVIQTKPQTQTNPASDGADDDASEQTESAFKPLLWIVIPLAFLLLYGALA